MADKSEQPISEVREAAEQDAFVPPEGHRRVFALISLGMFFMQMGESILAPFFPREAGLKGIGPGVIGWIFSIFELAVLAGTPLAIRALVRLGNKPLLVGANVVGGVAFCAMGFVWFAPSGPAFVGICFVLRIAAGMGFAMQSTSAYAMLPALFGPNISTASGTLEGLNGMAFIFGPIVGAGLFVAGGGEDRLGFFVPFIVLGCLEFLFAVSMASLLPKLPPPPLQQPSLGKFSWMVSVPVAVCICSGLTVGVCGPTLQPHLSAPPLFFSIPLVGVMFAALSGCYALGAPSAGLIDDHFEGRLALPLMFSGMLLCGVGFGLLAPLPLTIGGQPLQLSTAMAWVGGCCLGVGASIALVPVYKQILACALHETQEERDLATSAFLTLSFSAGGFLGPTLGGMMSEAFGVQGTYILCSAATMAMAAALLVLLVAAALRPAPAQESPLLAAAASDDPSSRAPLLTTFSSSRRRSSSYYPRGRPSLSVVVNPTWS